MSLGEQRVATVVNFAKDLRLAWKNDSRYPRSYPEATDWWFTEIAQQLNDKGASRVRTGKLPDIFQTPAAQHVGDLFDEQSIKAVYEDMNSDHYDDALKLADSGKPGATKAIHKLLKAAQVSDLIERGFAHPHPRVHFLHRRLLDFAAMLGLDDLTNKGLEEFFGDLCPCGRKHNAEALRKLRKRKQSESC